jgi:hypothetical protein
MAKGKTVFHHTFLTEKRRLKLHNMRSGRRKLHSTKARTEPLRREKIYCEMLQCKASFKPYMLSAALRPTKFLKGFHNHFASVT